MVPLRTVLSLLTTLLTLAAAENVTSHGNGNLSTYPSQSATFSSFSTSSSSAAGLGSYIAAGLGLTSEVDSPISATYSSSGPAAFANDSTPSLTETPYLSTSFRLATASTASTVPTAPAASAANSTHSPSYSSTYFHLATASSGLSPYTNSTNLTYYGNCWKQWNEYWSFTATRQNTSHVGYESTTTFKSTQTSEAYLSSLITNIFTLTWPEADGTPSLVPDGGTYYTQYSISTTVIVSTVTSSALIPTGTVSLPPPTTPACVLPFSVPDCQSSWDAWVATQLAFIEPPCNMDSNNSRCQAEWSTYESAISTPVKPSPICTQASIGGASCSALINSYAKPNTEAIGGFNPGGWITSWLSSTVNGSVSVFETSSWPSSSLLAPSCTVGCNTCSMYGESVKLMFWPPATSTGPNATSTAAASALVTSVGFGTTFTSPTVYISFDTLYASNSCGRLGRQYSNTIVAITSTAGLSSIWGYFADGYDNGAHSTASLNFTDLVVKPVPNSIFNRQPRCASSAYWAGVGPGALGWITPLQALPNTAYNCSRDPPLEPILVIPDEVRGIDAAWSGCIGGISGVYDPPTALTPQATVAMPTVRPAVATTPTTEPMPGSAVQPATASRTSGDVHTMQTVTEAGETAQSADPGSSTGPTATSAAPEVLSSTNQEEPVAPQETSTTDPETSQAASNADPTSPSAAPVADLTSIADPTPIADPSSSADPTAVADPTLSAGPTSAPDPTSLADPAPLSGRSSSSTQNAGGAIASLLGGVDSSTTQQAAQNLPGQTSTTFGEDPNTSPVGTETAEATTGGESDPTASGGIPTSTNALSVLESALSTPTSADSDPTLDSTPVTEPPGDPVAVGSNTFAPQNGVDPAQPITGSGVVLTLGSEVATALVTSGHAVIGSQTLREGGPAATISDILATLQPSGLMLGGVTHPVSAITAVDPEPTGNAGQASGAAIVTIGGQTETVSATSNQAVVGGQSLSVGGPAATVQGSEVTLAPSGVIVGDSTHLFSNLAVSSTANSDFVSIASISVGGFGIPAGGEELVAGQMPATGLGPGPVDVAGQYLSVGGPPMTVVQGLQLSLASSGLVEISGTHEPTIVAFSQEVLPLAIETAVAAVFTEGSQTLTALQVAGSSGLVDIDGTTLTVGDSAKTIEGEAVSVGTNGVLAGTQEIPWHTTLVTVEQQAVFTVTGASGEQTLTAIEAGSGSNIAVIDGTITLTAGGQAQTAADQTFSLASNGALVEDGSRTLPWSTLTAGEHGPTGTTSGIHPPGHVVSSKAETKTTSHQDNAGSATASAASSGSVSAYERMSFVSSVCLMLATILLTVIL